MRRQSVVDLYHEYGIERPARLVSSRGPSPSHTDDTPRQAHAQWTCHNCSWTNNSSTPDCWRCHVSANDGKLDVSDGAGASKTDKKARKPKPKPIFEPQTPNPPKAKRVSRQKSTPTIKFPSFDAKITTTASKDSRGPSPTSHVVSKELGQTPRNVSQKLRPQQSAPEQSNQPLSVPGLSPSRGQMKRVQESPFTKADRGTVFRSKKRPKNGSSDSPEKSECISPSCRAAYGGHKPHRHTITCTWNMRRIQEHTDKGYAADTSHIGDTTASYNSFAIASESDSHVFHSAREFRSDVSQTAKGNPANIPTDEKSAIRPDDTSRTSTVVPPKPLTKKKSSLPKPPIPPKKMSLKEFQRRKFPGHDINKTAPGRLVDDQLKSTLKEGSLSDATTILSNNPTSSTTRLQSLQTGITTPERVELSLQARQDTVAPKPLQKSEAEGETPVKSDWDTPLKRSHKDFPPGFKLRDKSSVPLLTNRLHEHQEELRSRRGGKSEDTLVSSVPFPKPQIATPKGLKDCNENCVSPAIPNQKKKLRLKVGSRVNMDGSPSSFENQRLSQSKDGGVEGSSGSEWREERSGPLSKSDMHECIWRKLFLEEQGGDKNGDVKQNEMHLKRGGIKGIKLVIELFGKEDLVLEGEF
ncbi:hypothetical protein HYALB_00007259 [Hymenoscyphus albidus]|uniref:RanBP2-type domain-containing protein n=1 Tax=Hymenoscyphus albidus TaxID=595503 RepID=A0A9N9LI55_9HELO|nr:hypothetical protein HYALB_00007259 [Hymenoscyphus albidus]